MGRKAHQRPVGTANPYEASLVSDAAAGSLEAFGELVDACQDEVYGYAVRVLGDAASARDVAQQTFVRAHRCLDQLRDPGGFRPWLRAIAVNQCRNWLKQQRRRDSRFVPLEFPGGGRAGPAADTRTAASPAAHAQANEIRTAVQAAVDSLTDTYREVAVMRYQNGLQVSQIADALGLSVAAVESRMRRARSELQARLSAFLEDDP